jgi:integrase
MYWAKFRIRGCPVPFFLSTQCRDRNNARDKRKEMISTEERRFQGLPTLDGAATERPLALVERFIADKKRLGRSKGHIANLEHRLKLMLDGAASIVELTPECIGEILARMAENEVKAREPGPDGKKPTVSARTLNAYRRDLRAFFRWLVKKKLWSDNPVDGVDPLPSGNPVFVYRSFKLEEKRAFFDKVPLERLAPYVVSASTGLRRSEMKRLLVKDLDLDPTEGAPNAHVRPTTAKNGKEAWVPLHPEAVVHLRALIAGQPPDAPVFKTLPNAARFNRDIEEVAGIKRETRAGRLTFTSLRKALVRGLDEADVSEGLIVKVMRHSDGRLVRGAYNQYELEAKAAAIEKLSFVSPERRAALGLTAPAPVVPLVVQHKSTDANHDAATCADGEDPSCKSVIPRFKSGCRLSSPSLDSPSFADAASTSIGGNEGHFSDLVSPLANARAPDPGSTLGSPRGPLARDPRALARDLLALAASAPDPAPLVEAARVLLAQAKADEEHDREAGKRHAESN